MYILFLSYFHENLFFSMIFPSKISIMKILPGRAGRPVVPRGKTEERTDRYGEVDSRSPQFCERA